jgi:hypothetical protein
MSATFSRLIFMLAFFQLQACWAGSVYKTVGTDGKVIYTDTPPTSGPVQTLVNIRSRAPVPEDHPVKTALMLYTKEIIVETAYRFCRDQVPDSTQAVKGAHDRWMEQHASLLSKKIPVLHDKLTVDELRVIAAQTEQENEKNLRIMRDAPAAERSKWCYNAPKTFASPEFNLAGNPVLVETIMNYKVKR